VYWAIGADLTALGINFNLAPCADVLSPADSPAVGTRSFGADTPLVAGHTAAAVTGLQAAGVVAYTKHFPDVRTAADAEPPVDHRGRAAGEHRGGPVHLGPEPVGAGRQRTPRPCPGGAGFAAGILEASAGRSLVLVVRDAHRAPATSSMVTELLTARPVLVLVEMGLPLWRPPDGTGHLVTYGASRASAQAAAERLGLL
jgi:hypothetical protein